MQGFGGKKYFWNEGCDHSLVHFGFFFHLEDYIPIVKYDKALITRCSKGIEIKCH